MRKHVNAFNVLSRFYSYISTQNLQLFTGIKEIIYFYVIRFLSIMISMYKTTKYNTNNYTK